MVEEGAEGRGLEHGDSCYGIHGNSNVKLC